MKTLRDKLSKLITPLPDMDPEQASIDSLGLTASNHTQEMDHYESVSRSKLRDSIGLHAFDPAYAGRKTSRQELENDSKNDLSEDNQDSDIDENEDSDNEDSDPEDSQGSFEFDNEENASQRSSSDSESDIEEDETIDDANEHVKRAIRNLQKDEEKLVHQLADSVKDELEKGRHVRSQMVRVWV
jgi:hypothetical protein